MKLAEAESYNVVRQFRKIAEMVDYFLDPERPFKLRPSHIATLHREALQGISPRADCGGLRPLKFREAGTSRRKPGRFRSGLKSFATM